MSKFLTRLGAVLHVSLYQKTDGKIGGEFSGRKVLLLKTVGRKSGKERIVPIVYVMDGEEFLVLASAAGAPKHPGWYWNIMADGAPVEIQVLAQTMPVQVTETEGNEREQAYSQYKAAMDGAIEEYEKKTERVFPLLKLTPIYGIHE